METGFDKYRKILKKRAQGYTMKDVVEEYVYDREGGGLVLNKKRISKKHIPPDITAIKCLMEQTEDANVFEGLSDRELEALRADLLRAAEAKREDVHCEEE